MFYKLLSWPCLGLTFFDNVIGNRMKMSPTPPMPEPVRLAATVMVTVIVISSLAMNLIPIVITQVRVTKIVKPKN